MPFKLAHRVKAHARIIWGASWTHDGAYFATASRDGSIKLWHSNSLSDKAKPVYTMQLKEPVVAIAFAPTSAEAESNRNYSLAVGLATGAISVWCVSCSTLPADGSAAKADAKRIWECPVATRHCASVRRLCWRQQVADECDDHGEERSMYLASCGDDHCVRIFSVSISA